MPDLSPNAPAPDPDGYKRARGAVRLTEPAEAVIRRGRDEAERVARCDYCRAPLGGAPGGWFSLATNREVCEDSPTSFHEAPKP